MRVTRRSVLCGIGVFGGALLGLRAMIPIWSRPGPVGPVRELSPGARRLVSESYEDVDPSRLWDVHTHVVGLGTGGTGCFASPAMQSHLHPIQRLQFDMYLAASGVRHRKEADAEFVARLKSLAEHANPDGRYLLMAFDQHVRPDGNEDWAKTPFHVPNEYVAELARSSAQFGFIASVHPYRKDALERLHKTKHDGAVAVKWLPNVMGIDPASPHCDSYYETLRSLGLVLISHAGIEQAVHSEGAQEFGNPLRLRRPLDHGVKVIAAHCASLGECRDTDQKSEPLVPALDLFLRLMDEDRYADLLYGDLSAITLRNREPRVLRQLLLRQDLHSRLANGSDYPLIAVDPVVSLGHLASHGVLEARDLDPLREIFAANALLFDYVLKRRIRLKEGGRTLRFLPAAFETRALFTA